MWALFLACTAEPCSEGWVEGAAGYCERAADSGDSEAQAGPDLDRGSWSLGPTQACAEPQPLTYLREEAWSLGELSWVETQNTGDDKGRVALLPDQGVVVGTGPWLGNHSWAFGEGEVDRFPLPPEADPVVLDVDWDGAPDLVHLQSHARVLVAWSAGEEQELVELDLGSAPEGLYMDAVSGDLDEDGDLDLVLGSNRLVAQRQQPAVLIENLGGRELGRARAATEHRAQAFDLLLADLDEDGHVDLYQCNDHGAELQGNQLFLGDGAGGLEEATPAGMDLAMDCMGVSRGDLDQDGELELLVVGSPRQVVLDHQEGAWFERPELLPGAEQVFMGWGSALVDLDNDGFTDALIGDGDFIGELDPDRRLHAWLGGPEGQLEQAASLGLDEPAGVRAILPWELNGDGVLDLVVGDADHPPRVWISQGCSEGAWLEVEGPEGSVVELEAGGQRFVAALTGDPGYGASSPPRAHLGLGEHADFERLVLVLPTGERVGLEGPIEARRRLAWSDSAE